MLSQHKGFTLNMLGKSPFMQGSLISDFMDDLIEKTDLEMTKSYQYFRFKKDGFVIGLADFACLGWNLNDLAGYPYDDENAALFSDWVKLGEDAENAKRQIEKTKAE